ncbi:cytochrome P450 family protein [Paracerasibacillus soli]|uniref:Cytochrome P450 n=1 Tax=Paracerasibacillus soli TaxID=480284 RepID=A0ABU5CV86_9BACI|nr:hypothetical protein [Virgibacillus soli]MDY0410287.1 hypothetical protein [Virgibacillus soli]
MVYREQIPIDKGIDNSLKLLMEGYQYIPKRRRKFNSDIFETRILGGQRTVCMAGADAAEIFYDNEKFNRHGVAPKRIRETIFGEKSVQTLDGCKHVHRKKLLMKFMSSENLQRIVKIVANEWTHAMVIWQQQDDVVLFEEMKKLLTIAACEWAGFR